MTGPARAPRAIVAAILAGALLALALDAVPARAFDADGAEREMAAIEARWRALTQAPRRDAKALAELDRRTAALAADVSRGLAALREEAAERDADMAAVVAGRDWQAAEALLLKLRFRSAAVELERALAGDPDKARLARAAADGFAPFVDAPDPALAAEARYGRGLARIAAGDRSDGLADLRAAANERSVAPRARLALAESLAEAGDRGQALDAAGKLLATSGLPRDIALRAKLLRLKLLLAPPGKPAPAAASAEVATLAGDLLAAGEPWRASALALLEGREELLPSGPDADASMLLLRADAAARRGDAAAAVTLYRQAAERGGTTPDPAALDGLARAAFASGDVATARTALERLRTTDRPWSRDLALLDVRSAYAVWQAAPDGAALATLTSAADALAKTAGTTPDDHAEAAYRKAEAARAAGDLDAALAGFAAIDAPAWQAAAGVAALQTRVMRHARQPEREPRDALLRDLGAALTREAWPADARATVVVLDATVRTTPAVPAGAGKGAGPAAPPPAHEEQRAALVRLRAFPQRFPESAALLPAVLRARALLELAAGETPDPGALAVLDEAARAAVAGAIAGDLREELSVAVAVVGSPAALGGASDAERAASHERARRALAAALTYAQLLPEAERADGRLELAQGALVLGDATTAVTLFRAEADAKPTALRALRGLALAARASGDVALERSAWDRLAAIPDLPPAVRAEVDGARGKKP